MFFDDNRLMVETGLEERFLNTTEKEITCLKAMHAFFNECHVCDARSISCFSENTSKKIASGIKLFDSGEKSKIIDWGWVSRRHLVVRLGSGR